jgi:plasmid stabilization system protein ParE
MKIVLSDKAKDDLFRVYSYIKERSPAAAEEILAQIDKKLEQLTWFPFIGRERSSLAQGACARGKAPDPVCRPR